MSPLAAHERIVLCQKMLCGGNFRYRQPFYDRRHNQIYENLDYLQRQAFRPGASSLILYLKEYGALDRAGGETYVRAIFQDLEPEGFYENP
jgi:replicative DNA helicase